MTAAPTRAVLDALTADGAVVRFVGGCVRDALLGRQVVDIDMATADTPDTVIALVERAGLKAVPTGIGHGTVTVISDGRPFEVTTLRRDVETDGRHARVAFIDDWLEDGRRRDFTFNAIYCDRDGTLHDPFGGCRDLADGRVRFVGAARKRIEEDVLRLLRFFRFFAWYGRLPADADALAACKAMASRLHDLSGERVGAEMIKLLAAPDPVPAIRLMADHGVLLHIVPEPRDDWESRLAMLVKLECAHARGAPIRRLAAIVSRGTADLAARLRFSRTDAVRLAELVEPAFDAGPGMTDKAARRALYRVGADRFRDLLLLAGAGAGGGPSPRLDECMAMADRWKAPVLPVRGRDVMALGVAEGDRVGELLHQVEAWWESGDYRATRGEALAFLKALVA